MAVDFKRWAVVAHKDDTGLGRQAADVRRVLALGGQIVIPSERLADRPLDPATEVVLVHTAPDSEVERVLAPWEGILFFERPGWHPRLLAIARRMGVKTVGVPNWEWFQGAAAEWSFCDLFVCPTQFTEQVVRGYGWRNTIRLNWCLDLARLPVRQVSGPARVFIHNAGLVDADDRKGTRDAIAAFARVKNPDVRLIVRMQKEVPLPRLDPRVQVHVGNLEDPAALYTTGDCAIQPSKMEGIGFMVLEPVACGLPVITLDYPPMNEFVAQPELRVAPQWFKRRAFPTPWVKQAHLRLPRARDLVRKIEWCAAHDLGPCARENRAWAERTFDVAQLRAAWSAALGALFR